MYNNSPYRRVLDSLVHINEINKTEIIYVYTCFFYKHTQCVKLVICSISHANLLYRSQWNQLVAILQIWNLQRGKRMHKFYLLLYHFRMYKLKHFDGQIIIMLTYHAGFYYIPINNLYTIQAHEYNKPDWKFRRSCFHRV